MENAHALVADAEQIVPLHDHERDKVHRLSHSVEVRELLRGVAVEALRVALEDEEELVNGYACGAPHVEEEHCVRGDCLHCADEQVAWP